MIISPAGRGGPAVPQAADGRRAARTRIHTHMSYLSLSLSLSMYVCVYLYIYIEIYMHIYMYVHTYIYIYIYIYSHTHLCTYLYVLKPDYIQLSKYMFVHLMHLPTYMNSLPYLHLPTYMNSLPTYTNSLPYLHLLIRTACYFFTPTYLYEQPALDPPAGRRDQVPRRSRHP